MIAELLRIADIAGQALLALQEQVFADALEGRVHRDKGAGDFATEADLESERIITRELGREFPGIPVIAEESHTGERLPSTYFAVDPLDGTIIYSRGCKDWGATICYVEDGAPRAGVIVYPGLGIQVVAERGKGCTINGRPGRIRDAESSDRFVLAMDTFYNTEPFEIQEILQPLVEGGRVLVSRATGAAVSNTLALLRGEVDLYYCARAKVWDLATCVLAVEESGGFTGALYGDAIDWRQLKQGIIFTSSRKLADEVGRIGRAAFARNSGS